MFRYNEEFQLNEMEYHLLKMLFAILTKEQVQIDLIRLQTDRDNHWCYVYWYGVPPRAIGRARMVEDKLEVESEVPDYVLGIYGLLKEVALSILAE